MLTGLGWLLLALGALVLSSGCEPKSHKKAKSSESASSAPMLTVTLARDGASTPYKVIVTATLRTASGVAAPGHMMAISATDGTAGAVTDNGDGTYTATVTPSNPAGEVPISIQATVEGEFLQQQRTALILQTINPAWGQPEAVRGSVNTPGYEDGPNISPDGQWLVVTDTSPVDAFCCITGCGNAPDAHSSYCQKVVAPEGYGPPSRPDFPGAWRIVADDHVLNKCPKACFTSNYTADGDENFGLPIPPIGSYIFKRQLDGSFAEPKLVGLDLDGCAPPTGISFAGPPSGTSAALVFDFNNPTGTGTSQIYWSPVTLGVTNLFANCACTSPGMITYTNLTALPLGVTYTQTRSNPSFRGGILWWDDEDTYPNPIYFSRASGAPLPNATFTPAGTTFTAIPVGTSGVDHSQPFFHAPTNTLYFRSGDVGFSAVTLGGGSDPATAADWSTETVILAGEGGTRTGAIVAVGQPTIGTLPGGTDELYFVYAIKTATGMGFNIGMVPKL